MRECSLTMSEEGGHVEDHFQTQILEINGLSKNKDFFPFG